MDQQEFEMNQKSFEFTTKKEREALFTYRLTSDETGMIASHQMYQYFLNSILRTAENMISSGSSYGNLSFYDDQGVHYSGWFKRLGEGFYEDENYSKTSTIKVEENVEVKIDVNFSLFHLDVNEESKRVLEVMEISEELKADIENLYLNNESYGLFEFEVDGVNIEAQWQVSGESWF